MPKVCIPLRDALYASFRAALASPDPAADFRTAVRAINPSGVQCAYIDDRIPRFVAVLQETRAQEGGDSFERALRMGRLLFNHGLFFDCHEYLEEEWRRTRPPRKTVLQGLIQAGAGFHKLELGSPKGAAELLFKAAEKLEAASPSAGCRYDFFIGGLRRAAESLREGGALAGFPKM